ncbi:hypothetical protein GCM10009847_21800 [Leucobacter tardus]|uniref:Uncharacterized protein n=1 Tax=Leucobacter tardus TaxID=501483 RepID=A0A939QLW2_9MICO|nr:TrbC/VirB2 family protein [Leucobacter tardus]MBO2990306.1 hypothetical protein [Leucobacter tardus]
MKTRTRIATAVTTALLSLFVAAPAFAAEGGHGGNDLDSMFSRANDSFQYGAIFAVIIILAVIVIATSIVVGRLFDKQD